MRSTIVSSRSRLRLLEQANQQLSSELAEVRQAERTLRDSEQRYRLLFESNPHPMWVYDLVTLEFLQVNDAAIQHYGYARDEFLAMTIKDIRPPEDIALLMRNVGRLRSGVDRAGVWRHARKDGTIISVEITSHPVELAGRAAVLVLALDVTERDRAQEALKNSDLRFRTLFELAPDGIYLIDPQGRFVDGNRAAEEMVGYGRHELIGKSFLTLDLLSGEDLQKAAAVLAVHDQGQPTGPQEYVLHRKGGTEVPVEIRTFPVQIQEQSLILGVARDLTERRRAEAALRTSKDNLTTIFNNVNVAIFIHQSDGRILAVNDKTLELFQVDREQALKLSIQHDYSDQTNPVETLPTIWNKVLAGETHGMEWISRRPANGSTFPTEVFLRRIRWDGQDALMATVYDLTEKKDLQKQLLRAQRLESIGTLAAGIAHDLNNILSPIMMSAQLLESDPRTDQESELIATIQASVQRGADIVRQVLTYARGVDGQRVPVQPRYLIKEVQKIIAETFPKNISFKSVIPHDLWTVIGDATQLHQVLINLCVNARDAMPQGGVLQLSAKNVHVSRTNAGLFGGGKPGPHVLLQVTDTGSGIPPGIIEKIFDPFFTTKELGKGTGLGLSTVLGILRSHSGFVDLESAPGRGSTFKAYLPATLGEAVTGGTDPISPARTGSGECILLVEDEVSLRAVGERTLVRHGYQVILAEDGQAALRQVSEHLAKIRAVVTDIMMPVMDGMTFVQTLKRSHPTLPVIACTGLGQEGIQAKLKGLGVDLLLEKPYSSTALLTALRDCLSAA